jgi:hypothetical protein
MEKKVRYKATGLVFGNYWGGGTGSYPARVLKADTKEDLIEQINKGINDGSLDSGMGYESLKGAIIDIETITSIEYENKTYTNKEYETETFGNLTDNQIEFLQRALSY